MSSSLKLGAEEASSLYWQLASLYRKNPDYCIDKADHFLVLVDELGDTGERLADTCESLAIEFLTHCQLREKYYHDDITI